MTALLLQNNIIREAFSASRCVSAIASEEEDNVEHIDGGMAASSNRAASSGSARHVCDNAAAPV